MGSLCLGETFPNFQAPAFGLENFDLYEYLGNSWGILLRFVLPTMAVDIGRLWLG